MKHFFLFLLMMVCPFIGVKAETIQEQARFLADKMAYELDLTQQQYEDCYEINYDFLTSVMPYMDDAAYGQRAALDSYYNYLDWRNDDLRYILNATQYSIFAGLDYFFRPFYSYGRHWLLRVFDVYPNHHSFFFNAPHIFHSYAGAHARHHYANGFYSHGRYNHQIAQSHGGMLRRGDFHHENAAGGRMYDRNNGFRSGGVNAGGRMLDRNNSGARSNGGNNSGMIDRNNSGARSNGGNNSGMLNRNNSGARSNGGNNTRSSQPSRINNNGMRSQMEHSGASGSHSGGHTGGGSHGGGQGGRR